MIRRSFPRLHQNITYLFARHSSNDCNMESLSQVGEMASWPKVPRQEALDFCSRCMQSVGTKVEHAEALAELLMVADYRGHYSHGLNRLGIQLVYIPFKSFWIIVQQAVSVLLDRWAFIHLSVVNITVVIIVLYNIQFKCYFYF